MKNVYVALENIRSLHNVGAIFRTCSFFGITKILLVGYTAKDINNKLHTKITRSSLGAEQDLDIKFFETAAELITFANAQNLKVVCVEQTKKSVELKNWIPEDSIILIFGNENDGISSELLDAAHITIEVSRHGKHNSLNVSTCTGIVLFELTEKTK